MKDLRYALRTLASSPGFTAVAVIALGLGIGANTAIFSVVDAVLLRDLPFKDPDRLAMVWEKHRSNDRNVVNPINFLEWRSRNTVFESIAAMVSTPSTLTGVAEPEQVDTAIVSSGFFETLGVKMLRGRSFLPAEERPGSNDKVILTYELWRRRFGGDPGVLGRKLTLSGSPVTVVGVLRPRFSLPGLKADLFGPLAIDRAKAGGRFLRTVARLQPAVSVEQARQAMVALAAQMARDRPDYNTGWSANVTGLHENAVREVKPALIILFVAVGLVALIACANVANLMLMRGASRSRELAVRAALGASRTRIVRQLLAESVLLALVGAALGSLIAFWGVPALLALVPQNVTFPRAGEVGLDARVLGFTALLALGSALLFGVAPALRAARVDLIEALRAGGRGAQGGVRSRTRNALVVAEVALATLLFVGAGLMAKSFVSLAGVDPGFRPERVLTFSVAFSETQQQGQAGVAFLDRVLDRVRSIPGVAAAGSVHFLPLSGLDSATGMIQEGRQSATRSTWPGGGVSVITSGYLRAMGIPILRGRDIEARDRAGAPPVMIVNEAAARAFFPGEDALGKRMIVQWTDDRPIEIVGIVPDVRHENLTEAAGPAVYLPNAQNPVPLASVVVRTAGDPAAIARALRTEVRAVDKDQPLANLREMTDVVSESVARPRLNAVLLGLFAGLALALAAVGTYGVLAYSVGKRTQEIGVRMALGAAPSAVMRSVMTEGALMAGIGIAAGLAGALLLTRYISTLLFGVKPTDAAVFSAAALALFAVALIATYLPARQATRVDPMIALREE